jgi:hypothetical protein
MLDFHDLSLSVDGLKDPREGFQDLASTSTSRTSRIAKLLIRGRSLVQPQKRGDSRPALYHDIGVRGSKNNPSW